MYEEVETNGHDIADEEVIHEQQGYSEVDQVEQESIQVNGIEEPSEPDHVSLRIFGSHLHHLIAFLLGCTANSKVSRRIETRGEGSSHQS